MAEKAEVPMAWKSGVETDRDSYAPQRPMFGLRGAMPLGDTGLPASDFDQEFDLRLQRRLKELQDHIHADHIHIADQRERHLRSSLHALHVENKQLRERLNKSPGNAGVPQPVAVDSLFILGSNGESHTGFNGDLASKGQRAEEPNGLPVTASESLGHGSNATRQVSRSSPVSPRSQVMGPSGSERSQESAEEPLYELWSTWVSAPEHKMHPQIHSSATSGPETLNNISRTLTGFEHGSRMAKLELALTLNPNSNLFLAWQFLFTVVLCYELIMFPMDVFAISQSSVVSTLAWFTAAFWSLDIVVTLNTSYYNKQGNTVMARKLIFWHYLKVWMIPDIIVVALDWIMLLDTGDSESNLLKFGKLLRYLRMARLLRLLRLRKLNEAMARIDDYINSVYFTAVKSIVVNMASIIVISHFLGCAWYAVGMLNISGYETWVVHHEFEDAEWFYAYLTSLHWSITQFTPGSMHVQPQNIPERAFAIGMLVMGMIIFSSIVSNITMSTNNLKQITARYDKQLTLLRRFLKQEKISQGLTSRVVRYADHVVKPKLLKISSRDVELLTFLPTPLYMEVVTDLYEHHLSIHPLFLTVRDDNIPLLQKICFKALDESCLASHCVLFGPGETADCMYFQMKGDMEYTFVDLTTADDPSAPSQPSWTKHISGPSWFVEQVLWCPWVYQGRMKALSECELLRINSNNFRELVHQNSMGLKAMMHYAVDFVRSLNEAATRGDSSMCSDIAKLNIEHEHNQISELHEQEGPGARGGSLLASRMSG